MEFQVSVRHKIRRKCVSSHVVIQFGFDFAKVEFSEDVKGLESDMRVIRLMSCVLRVFSDVDYVFNDLKSNLARWNYRYL